MKPIYQLSLSLFFLLSASAFGQCPDSLLIAQGECETVQVSLVFEDEVNAVIWYWGDGSTSDGTLTEAHTYAEPGEYNLCVEVYTDDCPDGAEICQAVVIPDCSSDCELDMEVLQDGDTLLFYPFNDPDNAMIEWTLNGELIGSGDLYAISIAEPGVYEVCAMYETPECPEGVFWCETWTVQDQSDCPEEGDFVYEMIDCDSYIFEIGNFIEGAEVFWNFGDGDVEWAGHVADHTYDEDGVYTVLALYNSPYCEDSIYFQETIEVDCGVGNDCELELEVMQDGDILYFTPFNYPDDATIFWSVNGQGFGPGDEFTFDLSEPGTYQICAAYETPECPEAVTWCETWTVEGEGDCPGEGDFGYEMIDCDSYIFEIGNFMEGVEVHWNFGDGQYELGGHVADHTFEEDGVYSVWALYFSPFCEDSLYFQETIQVDCGGGDDCELDVEVVQDGDTVLFYPFNYPDNAMIEWTLNGELIGSGDLFAISIAEPGVYEVCAMYETPECPEGVFWCETWTVDDDDCPFELSVEETEQCGCYELSLNGQWGSQYIWNLGDTSYTSFSNAVIHCYEPGNYTGYVQILNSNYPECEQDPVVFSIEVPECEEPDCYWFNFQISNNIPGVSFNLDWSITDLDNELWGNGTIGVEGDSTTYTGEICVGTGCYILDFEAPFPIVPENLDIDFISIIDPIIPVTIEWIQDDNPYTVTAQIGIAETCNWPVSVDENGLELTQVYPLPAHDFLNIKLNHEMPTDLRLYNINGQEVLRQNLQQSGPIDVSSLPAGLYLLQLQQGNNFKTFSIPLLN